MYKNLLKPAIDYLIAFCLLILLSPLLLVISVLLTFSNKGNPFFLQKRPGKDGVIFKIIKFKTMRDPKPNAGESETDYQRLTFIGKIVRLTSIDELPQLVNILKGEMSIVGPRPLLPQYLELYNEEQKKRHLVKPGITGWAQVNGRNALTWEEKFRYDVEYVENISARLDAKIVLITIEKVMRRKGVNANNYMTMEAFKGNTA